MRNLSVMVTEMRISLLGWTRFLEEVGHSLIVINLSTFAIYTFQFTIWNYLLLTIAQRNPLPTIKLHLINCWLCSVPNSQGVYSLQFVI